MSIQTVIKGLLSLAVIVLSAATSYSASLIDDFNRPDNPSISGATGQSGTLAPLNYTEVGAVSLVNGQVALAGASIYAGFFPNFDFAAPEITAGGRFAVSFRGNPVVGGNATRNGFIGLSLGHSSTSAGLDYAIDVDALMAFGLIFRDNGQFVVFDDGTGVLSGTFDSSPVGNENYAITVTIATSGVTVGGAAVASALVDGIPIEIGGPGVFERPFIWNRAQNFLTFSASVSQGVLNDPSTIDAISVQTVPEPTVILLAVIGCTFLGMRRTARRGFIVEA